MTENIPKKYLHVAIGLDYELSTGRLRDLKTHSHLHGKSDTKRHADTRIRSNTQKTRWDKKCEWKWWSGKKHIFKVNRKRQSRVKIARGIRCLLADWLVGSWMMNASSDEAAAAEKNTNSSSNNREKEVFSSLQVDIFPSTSCKECYQTGCVCAQFHLEAHKAMSPNRSVYECFAEIVRCWKDELRAN